MSRLNGRTLGDSGRAGGCNIGPLTVQVVSMLDSLHPSRRIGYAVVRSNPEFV